MKIKPVVFIVLVLTAALVSAGFAHAYNRVAHHPSLRCVSAVSVSALAASALKAVTRAAVALNQP
jgi:hypothetical protein